MTILDRYNSNTFISYSSDDREVANTLRMYLLGDLVYAGKDFWSPRYKNTIFIENQKTIFGNPLKIGGWKICNVFSFLHDVPIPGSHFPSKIKEEIRNSKTVIVLIGKNSVSSKWVNFEIELSRKLNKIIIPVMLDSVSKLPNVLINRQAIQAYKNPDYWIIDIGSALKAIRSLNVGDRIEFDKKTHKPLSFKEEVQLKMRDIYGFDIF